MAPARKRKHRGRPPGKGVRNKSAMLSARITPETRAMLVAASKAAGKSLGQEIEERLQGSFRSAGVRSGLDKQPDHQQALGVLVAMLAEKIEAATGLSWRADERVREAIVGGIEAMLRALSGGRIPTSASSDDMRPWIESIVRKDDVSSAHYYGALEASKSLIQIAWGDAPPPSPLATAEEARLAWIREKLGLQKRRDPRDWDEMVRLAREELGAEDSPLTESKYAGKKS